MKKLSLDIKALKEVLSYDPESGLFTWQKRTSTCVRVGAVAGCKDAYGYVVIRIYGVLYKAHRLAFAFMGKELGDSLVDHKDGNPSNNRFSNLRPATHDENMRHSKKQDNCTSKWKGVCWDKRRGKWISRIVFQGRVHNLGRFDCEREAAEEYMFAALELHGDYARLQ
ncbi:MAG TPA: HNH endonuclease [Anaerolineales bacterium]|nr:HNH endonuclease [Anaerolineales bacterium]